jgi:DNA polymerase-3 subunit alpha
LAEKIWNVLLPFSSYAFNKSHSAAYATIAYQTGYLKAHYPAQFMAANLTSEFNDNDRLVILINDCNQLGIRVLPPCINRSSTDFISRENTLLYGLSGIKNVGIDACRKLIEERTNNGPFKSVHDLCRRMEISDLNRRAIESLILAGALDALPGNRAQQFASVEQAMSIAAKIQKDKALGQTSLFHSGQGKSPLEEDSTPPPDVDAWPYNEMLAKEKEVLGLYLSGHPLEPYRMEMEAFTASNLDKESLSRLKMESDVILGGVITSLRKRISQKDNRAFAFGVLEDFTGKLEVVFWSDVYEKVQESVEVDALLLIHGKIRRDMGSGNGFKFVANKVLPLTESRDRLTRSVNVRLHTAGLQKDTVDNLHDLCRTWEGNCRFIFHLQTAANGSYVVRSGNVRVACGAEFTDALADVAGRENVWLSK